VNERLILFVDDVETLAREFCATTEDQAWGRELLDPDGNRLRIGPTHE
jgi:hypothetical protein